MILYLDTSSLVKLYLDEAQCEAVRRWAQEASVVATSVVAYAEAAAAFGRRQREGALAGDDLRRVLAALDADWGDYAVVGVDERRAGALAVRHGLRGFDAIHLAAALGLRQGAEALDAAFSSFDGRLNDAAVREGLRLLSP